MAPKRRILSLSDNELLDLPASFIDAVLSHPTLEELSLYGNRDLVPFRNPSAPCAIPRLLSRLLVTASSSSLTLRTLSLDHTGATLDCCLPIFEQVLSLGSRGLEHLSISILATDRFVLEPLEPLARIISEKNRFIKTFALPLIQDELAPKNMLSRALERNKQLQSDTHNATFELLEVARTIFLSSPAPASASTSPPLVPSPPSTQASPSDHFCLLDLPVELQMIVLSFVPLGALIDRQIESVLRYAADRTTLQPVAYPLDADLFWRAVEKERRRLLEEVSCHQYDFEG